MERKSGPERMQQLRVAVRVKSQQGHRAQVWDQGGATVVPSENGQGCDHGRRSVCSRKSGTVDKVAAGLPSCLLFRRLPCGGFCAFFPCPADSWGVGLRHGSFGMCVNALKEDTASQGV